MPLASFNPAHEKHTKKTDDGTGEGTCSVGYKIPGLEIATEIRLTELDDVPAEKRERCSTENRHKIRNDYPVIHRIVETHEEKETQGHVRQKMRALVLPHDVLGNEDIPGQRQVDDR